MLFYKIVPNLMDIKIRRKTMKKLLALILALVMVFSFAACDEEEPANNNDVNNGETEEPV